MGAVALGAGLAYFLDPQLGPGRRRRAGERLGLSRPVSRGYGMRAGDIDGLAVANLRRMSRSSGGRQGARLAAAALALYGLLRPGAGGTLAKLAGVGLAAITPAAAPPRATERRRTIDIQKSLFVDAPADRVFAFSTSYDNLPLFLSAVREVRPLGGTRSRWVVRGPRGAAVTWTVAVTERVPGRLLAWRSDPGAALEHAGVLRFRPEGPGTRIDLRFCYSPPGGRAGATLAAFFGGDPRARINDDLKRLASLLESTVRSDVHGE